MKSTRWVTLMSITAGWVGIVACGSGDISGTGTGPTAGTASHTGGRSGTGGTTAAGGTAAAPGTGGTGSSTLAGTCNVSSAGICYTYYCVDQSVCSALAQSGPQSCESESGTWSTSACSTAGSVGSCRMPASTGDTVVTYYSTSGATTATVQQACTSAGGTFTNP
jgi:hypothetical protein